MRASLVAALIVSVLSGCNNPASDAEKELAILEKSDATKDEICAAKTKVAEAYLRAQHEEKYKATKRDADAACNAAQIERRLKIY